MPYLYFVFGTNTNDFNFLQQFCNKDSMAKSRRLTPHTPQTSSRNAVDLYSCNTFNISNNSGSYNETVLSHTTPYSFKVLYMANCTGEYFGSGPTCRCQESMRYFNTAQQLRDVEWFVFIDDDIYLRPYALASMLGEISPTANANNNNSDNKVHAELRHNVNIDGPVALVAPVIPRNFEFSKAWRNIANCTVPKVHDFFMAQPAILNR